MTFLQVTVASFVGCLLAIGVARLLRLCVRGLVNTLTDNDGGRPEL